jgi:hypothetical protein
MRIVGMKVGSDEEFKKLGAGRVITGETTCPLTVCSTPSID